MSSELDEIIRTSAVIVHPGRYAYLKATRKPAGSHFLIAEDADEITVVTDEPCVETVPYHEAVKWFRLLEVRVSAPFEAKGFLAAISRALADRGLSVLIVSTFSKDYVLVREEAVGEAVDALRQWGFPVRALEASETGRAE